MNEQPKQRAVIYLRVSQDRTGERNAVERQREICEQRVRERGWELVREPYEDNDASAKGKKAREGFQSMLDLIAQGGCDVVVAGWLDRLQRNRRDEARLYELCEQRGVTIAIVNGQDMDMTTAGGRLVASVLGAVARQEIEVKSERQRLAYTQAAERGRWVGGRRPFGFDADGMTVREEEAAAIRAGFAAIIAGATLTEVGRSWNALGFRTGQGQRASACGEEGGNEWGRSSVRDVILNPRYAGIRARKAGHGRYEHFGPAAWPAIVDEDAYEAARAVLTNEARRSSPSARGVRLLSGIATCGVCGAKMHAGGNARPGVPAYRCSGSLGHVARKSEPVDAFVTDVIVARLSQPDARDLLIDTGAPDLDALRTEAHGLRERQEALALDYADGLVAATAFRAATARVNERLARVETVMSDRRRVEALGPLVNSADVRAAWEEAPMQRRRAVLAMLMDVTLHPVGRGTRNFNPATVGIAWKAE